MKAYFKFPIKAPLMKAYFKFPIKTVNFPGQTHQNSCSRKKAFIASSRKKACNFDHRQAFLRGHRISIKCWQCYISSQVTRKVTESHPLHVIINKLKRFQAIFLANGEEPWPFDHNKHQGMKRTLGRSTICSWSH